MLQLPQPILYIATCSGTNILSGSSLKVGPEILLIRKSCMAHCSTLQSMTEIYTRDSHTQEIEVAIILIIYYVYINQ